MHYKMVLSKTFVDLLKFHKNKLLHIVHADLTEFYDMEFCVAAFISTHIIQPFVNQNELHVLTNFIHT